MRKEATKLKVLDLFSGIGGFSLGLERTGGFETVAFCEIDPFCQKILAKHWPNVKCYNDVRTIDYDGAVDVITGGFPCQDISVARGTKSKEESKGTDGERSGLWSEIVRLACKFRPKIILVENVTNLLIGPSKQPGGWFSRVLGDLASIGYDAEWHCLRGTDFGVPQSRPRVFIIAYPARTHSRKIFHKNPEHVESYKTWLDAACANHANANNQDNGTCALSVLGDIEWTSIPNRERSGSNERLSAGLGRYKSIGNTVIPQKLEAIGHAILATL